MLSSSFKLGIANSPLRYNLYSSDDTTARIVPGEQKFIMTEDGKHIATEDGKLLVTEN